MFKEKDWFVMRERVTVSGERILEPTENFRVGKLISVILSVVIGLIFFFGSWGVVSPGQRGIKIMLGSIKETLEPGLYFKFPLVEKVHIVEVKTRTVSYEITFEGEGEQRVEVDNSLAGASKDLQDVSIGVVVNYHVKPDAAAMVYSQYRSVDNFETDVIAPIIKEFVKSSSAQYTAEELVVKRSEFSDKVNFSIKEQFESKDAVLEKFSITNFKFSEAFTASIEAKVTAVQNAEAAKNKLEQIKFEAQQTIEKAKAVAESIKIQAEAITSQGGEAYVNLQWIDAWKAGGAKVPMYVAGDGGNGFIMNLPEAKDVPQQ